MQQTVGQVCRASPISRIIAALLRITLLKLVVVEVLIDWQSLAAKCCPIWIGGEPVPSETQIMNLVQELLQVRSLRPKLFVPPEVQHLDILF